MVTVGGGAPESGDQGWLGRPGSSVPTWFLVLALPEFLPWTLLIDGL